MKNTGKAKKMLSLALSLLLAFSFAPLFSVLRQTADAAVATNHNSSNFVAGHYYYYPEGTRFIKSINVGFDKNQTKAINNSINADNPYILNQDWLDGMGSNIFKRYNYIYIAYGLTTDITQAWGTYIRMKHSSGADLTHNFTVNGNVYPFVLGSGVDFNHERGNKSDYIYLYKTNDPALGLPITAFRSGDGNFDAAKWESYFLTAERDDTGKVSDLNRNAGGKYLWLHYGDYSVYTDVTTQINALKAAIDTASYVRESDCTAQSYAALVSAANAASVVWDAYNANMYRCATITPSQIENATADVNRALNAITARGYTMNFYGQGNTGGAMTSQLFTIHESKALSANGYTRDFTVTYDYNGATDGNGIREETAVSQFIGWATDPRGQVVYADRQVVQELSTEESAQIDLYAKWEDSALTLPSPVKEGYTFDGWYTDPSCNISYKIGVAGSTYTPPMDVTLYAKWNANVYTLQSFTVGQGYEIFKRPSDAATVADTVSVKLNLDADKVGCEPVLSINTGCVVMEPYQPGTFLREYTITGITSDYTISIGDAVPPTYTVAFVDGLSGETLKEITDLPRGATELNCEALTPPAVDEYVTYSDTQHLAFTGWDQPYSPVLQDMTVTSVYAPADHVWGEPEVTTPANCQSPGEATRRCACGEAKTEAIPAGSHSYTARIITDGYMVSGATCTAAAVYNYACAGCGEKGTGTYTYGDPLPHSLAKTNGKAPACTEGGWEAYWTCGTCGRMFSDENGVNWISDVVTLGALGHDMTKTPAKPATCVNAGACAYYTCGRCGLIFSDEAGTNEISMEETVQQPTGSHTLRGVAAVPVTCTADGRKAYWICTVCGELFADENAAATITESELVIPHSGHDFTAQRAETRYLKVGATCTTSAVYAVSCVNCGLAGEGTFTCGEPAPHDFYWIVDVRPTCSTPGTKHQKCRNCPQTASMNTETPATGAHEYFAQTANAAALQTPATCIAPAVYYYSCAVCGRVEGSDAHTFTAGNAKGHVFSDWITDAPATCQTEGRRHRVCGVCNYTENASIARTGHTDANGDFRCDDCGTDVSPQGACPYCHGTHEGVFGAIISFFHSILYFFSSMFGGR